MNEPNRAEPSKACEHGSNPCSPRDPFCARSAAAPEPAPTQVAIARAEALAQEWRDTAEQYRIDLQVARDALASAQLQADAEKSRAENLQAACEVLKADREAAYKRADAAHDLLREWSNFDFDCPEEEYDAAEDRFEEDGHALEKLYAQTAELLSATEAT